MATKELEGVSEEETERREIEIFEELKERLSEREDYYEVRVKDSLYWVKWHNTSKTKERWDQNIKETIDIRIMSKNEITKDIYRTHWTIDEDGIQFVSGKIDDGHYKKSWSKGEKRHLPVLGKFIEKKLEE